MINDYCFVCTHTHKMPLYDTWWCSQRAPDKTWMDVNVWAGEHGHDQAYTSQKKTFRDKLKKEKKKNTSPNINEFGKYVSCLTCETLEILRFYANIPQAFIAAYKMYVCLSRSSLKRMCRKYLMNFLLKFLSFRSISQGERLSFATCVCESIFLLLLLFGYFLSFILFLPFTLCVSLLFQRLVFYALRPTHVCGKCWKISTKND